MRGSGPGGQSVATTSNAVQLIHLPTGVSVKCHESRSVDTNRRLAKIKLIKALDNHFNKEDSVEAQAARIKAALHEAAATKAKTKRERNLLNRLREKELKLSEKLDKIRETADEDPYGEQKILDAEEALTKIEDQISKLIDDIESES